MPTRPGCGVEKLAALRGMPAHVLDGGVPPRPWPPPKCRDIGVFLAVYRETRKGVFMRIRGPGSIQAPKPSSSKQTQSADGGFRSLLQQRIESLREDGTLPTDMASTASWGMIEDAAQMLDEAMSRLQSGEIPDPEIVQNLRELRKKLHEHMPEGEDFADLDALIAVETHRLERW